MGDIAVMGHESNANPLEQGTFQAEILRCDVAIVGGGIAGIACAERLAREARRQGKQLRIAVIEQRDRLADATSGRLEGWYHTGALYSTLDDPRTFTYLLFAYEDLYNWYGSDPAFPFRTNCNLTPIRADRPTPAYDLAGNGGERWFVDRISYLVAQEPAMDTPSYAARGSRAASEAAARAKYLIANAFYRCSWRNVEFNCVQAPHLRTTAGSGGDFALPRELVNLRYEDVVRDCFADENPAGLKLALEEAEHCRRDLQEITARIQSREGTVLDVVPSRDAVMDTYRILHDLACSAAGHGVKFLTGCKLDSDSVQISRTSDRVQGLNVGRTDGQQIHVLADQYVFALGCGFDETDLLRRTLGIRVRIEKTISVMLATRPPLRPGPSFARLEHAPERTVNHICHPGSADGTGYSIIADANGLAIGAAPEDCYVVARNLLEKAEAIYGPKMRDHRLAWYSCLKTEGIALEGSRRDYSYWLEPRFEYHLVNGAWNAAKDQDQKGIQEQIKRWVMEPGAAAELPAPMEDSGWALGKAIHFALQRLAFSCRPGEPGHTAAHGNFERVRDGAIAAYDRYFEGRSALRPNYICTLPGKFSLFPTLAHQVYIELEVRGVFKRALDAPTGQSDSVASCSRWSLPSDVAVSRPLAVELLAGDPEWEETGAGDLTVAGDA